jgi:hypothetical protein
MIRIAIVGDVGTNDKHHIAVLEGIKSQGPNLVIHLGDVYVAGTSSECKKFWEVWESERNKQKVIKTNSLGA